MTAYLLAHRIFAILRGIHGDALLRTAEALLTGGIAAVELPFDRSGAFPDEKLAMELCRLREAFGGDLRLGTGTVLTPEQVTLAKDAGSEYIVSPSVEEAVIRKTRALGLTSIPGALTPTEVHRAMEAGGDLIKLFPADLFGAAYMKSLLAPFPTAKLCATGGVNRETLADYLRAGCTCVAVGGDLADPGLIAEKNWGGLCRRAREYCRILEEV